MIEVFGMKETLPGAFIVTGGSSGMGEAVLDKFKWKFSPHRVFNIDVNYCARPLDVRDYEAVYSVMEMAIIPEVTNYLFSGVGALFVLDPESKKPADFASLPITHSLAMANINFIGQMNVLHAFFNVVREREALGNVVVVSSIAASISCGPVHAVYGATKAALSKLAKDLSLLSPRVRINIVSPGSVRTNIGAWNLDFTLSHEGAHAVQHGQDADQKALGREVTLQQIINNVGFLFFTDHGLNGAEIVIDEGLTKLVREGY